MRLCVGSRNRWDQGSPFAIILMASLFQTTRSSGGVRKQKLDLSIQAPHVVGCPLLQHPMEPGVQPEEEALPVGHLGFDVLALTIWSTQP
jgi:hypothetical protein